MRSSTTLWLAAVALTVGAAAPARASLMAYMAIRGARQGIIQGGVTQKGREGKIGVIAMDHQVLSPREPGTGLASGKRQHRPLTVSVEWDKAMPALYRALFTNEELSEVRIEFWTPQIRAASGVGGEVQHATIRLTGAAISSIRNHMPNVRNPELVRYNEYLDIDLTYRQIEVIWVDGGGTATDDWNGRTTTAPSTPGGRRLASGRAAATVAPRRGAVRRPQPRRRGEARLASGS